MDLEKCDTTSIGIVPVVAIAVSSLFNAAFWIYNFAALRVVWHFTAFQFLLRFSSSIRVTFRVPYVKLPSKGL